LTPRGKVNQKMDLHRLERAPHLPLFKMGLQSRTSDQINAGGRHTSLMSPIFRAGTTR